MYNHSKITYPHENTIARESCLKKLTLELDLLMGSWNKKMTKGPLTVFVSFLQHYCYRFYVSLTTVCCIFAGDHTNYPIHFLHIC